MGPLDLNALAQTAMQLLQIQSRNHALTIQADLASDLPQVLGDSNQLLQVCRHILANLTETLAKTDGIFRVQTYCEMGRVVIEFSGDSLARVADGPSSHQTGKAGATLNACYGIVHEHSGTISRPASVEGRETIRLEFPPFNEPGSVGSNSARLPMALLHRG